MKKIALLLPPLMTAAGSPVNGVLTVAIAGNVLEPFTCPLAGLVDNSAFQGNLGDTVAGSFHHLDSRGNAGPSATFEEVISESPGMAAPGSVRVIITGDLA